jgi:hypothetical protein
MESPSNKCIFKCLFGAGCRWLIPVILDIQEAEIRRIPVQRQPRKIVCETLSQKNSSQKRAGVAQSVGPEFKSQTAKKKKRKCTFG